MPTWMRPLPRHRKALRSLPNNKYKKTRKRCSIDELQRFFYLADAANGLIL